MHRAFKLLKRHSDRERLLYGNALIALVSAAEWFLAQVLHFHFRRQPGSLGLRDKVFSYEDLERFGVVEDAKRYLVDSKVEDVLRGSVEDWINFLKTKVSLSMGYLSSSVTALIEISQRRNLLVHNGGIVNSIYMSRVDASLRKGIQVGKPIELTREYLDRSIGLVEKNFTLIGAELWKQLSASDDERAGVLTDLTLEHLGANRFEIAEAFSFFVRNDKGLPERSLLVATLNYWQSLKWAGRFKEIEAEVSTADLSAKDEIFHLGQAVLLDDFGRAAELAGALLTTKKLKLEALEQWPIFRDFRQTAEYSALIATAKVTPDSNVDMADLSLGGHPKPAINRHLKTGHFLMAVDP